MFKRIYFNIRKQYFFTRNNILIIVLPLIILWIIYISCMTTDIDLLKSINSDIISLFVWVVSIIMWFLINFLVLTKTWTNTLFHKFDKEYKECLKEAWDDTTKVDDCELEYNKNKKEVFYKLNFKPSKSKRDKSLKVEEDIELYIYNKIFFIIFLSVFFPLFYFISINFIDILFSIDPIFRDILRWVVLYFILFYLFNIINLLSFLYVLFFSDNTE